MTTKEETVDTQSTEEVTPEAAVAPATEAPEVSAKPNIFEDETGPKRNIWDILLSIILYGIGGALGLWCSLTLGPNDRVDRILALLAVGILLSILYYDVTRFRKKTTEENLHEELLLEDTRDD